MTEDSRKDDTAMMTRSSDLEIKTVYCPHCHLATRANCNRCLHCEKLISKEFLARRPLAEPDKSVLPGRSGFGQAQY